MICLLVMTDGRDELLERTLASFDENVRGPITKRIIHADTDPTHAQQLARKYAGWTVIGGKRAGFGGAIARAWSFASQYPEEFVFHLEDDFTFNRELNLHDVMRVLIEHPHLVQMALRRQPWNDDERAAGGIVEQDPDAYVECADDAYTWLEHRKFFTTNPSLVPMSIVRGGWPQVDRSEGIFSIQLFTNPDLRSAYWGARDSGEWVTHIGEERVGRGY